MPPVTALSSIIRLGPQTMGRPTHTRRPVSASLLPSQTCQDFATLSAGKQAGDSGNECSAEMLVPDHKGSNQPGSQSSSCNCFLWPPRSPQPESAGAGNECCLTCISKGHFRKPPRRQNHPGVRTLHPHPKAALMLLLPRQMGLTLQVTEKEGWMRPAQNTKRFVGSQGASHPFGYAQTTPVFWPRQP